MREPADIRQAVIAAAPNLSGIEIHSTVNDLKQLLVPKHQWSECVRQLRDHEQLKFDHLINYLALESAEHIEVILILRASKEGQKLQLRCRLPQSDPSIQSITSVYPGASWFEREMYDLFGIRFPAHPDLRRVLLPPCAGGLVAPLLGKVARLEHRGERSG